jgi:hypothetical protein
MPALPLAGFLMNRMMPSSPADSLSNRERAVADHTVFVLS